MKAILVIDVPVEDSTDFGHLDIRADIYVDAYNDLCLQFKHIELKKVKVEAMPQKKNKILLNKNTTIKDFNSYCSYRDGWNDCVDEILERTDESN